MRKLKLSLGLITATIGLSGSAFTIRSHNQLTTTTDLYWYGSIRGAAVSYFEQNTTANEIARMQNLFGRTYNTIPAGGTFALAGFIFGGSGVTGSGLNTVFYSH